MPVSTTASLDAAAVDTVQNEVQEPFSVVPRRSPRLMALAAAKGGEKEARVAFKNKK
jgi:hypothetical protein